ncbi:LLM class flavin-dependent oxidoreductase [Actinomadura decatromicini]|uniref:LLM class flavin-dependent oxidoreductase n=1 Tax=Actinomadura decatromicini TaxID=2604572 RepID=A0A5D3FSV7_9ACTN|nr:LLM class flavin-dependent oxidoreductase [Actinomadura decatromicini]TYK50996.1 LLM class flavin-dependent oxidoreductase [Actinomadura decatromicini]
MSLGLSIASNSALPHAELGELARTAEDAGYDAVFVAEVNGDALALCQPLIAATGTVAVGTAIANAALRPPVLAARTAVHLDDMSGGRFRLGLGLANAARNAQLGLPPLPPLQMIEEYVAVLRAALAGEPGFDGAVFRTGRVLFDRPPHRADLPIHLAALGPRMLRLAGRVADGVILNLMSPDRAAEAAAIVRESALEAGRDPADVEISCVVHTCLSDDAEAAARGARAVVPRYALHPAAPSLFGDPLDAVRERVGAGDLAGAVRHVPQHVADLFVAHGDPAACRARIEEYRKAGVDMPVVYPIPVDGAWPYADVISRLSPATGIPREGRPGAA